MVLLTFSARPGRKIISGIKKDGPEGYYSHPLPNPEEKLFFCRFISGITSGPGFRPVIVVSTILFNVKNDRIYIVEFVSKQHSFLLPTSQLFGKVIAETKCSRCMVRAITFLTFIALFQQDYIAGSRSHFESILHQGRLLNISPKK